MSPFYLCASNNLQHKTIRLTDREQVGVPIICGNDLSHHIVAEQYPDFDMRLRQISPDALLQTQHLDAQAVECGGVRTIRIVVHVGWKNANENLAESVISSQTAVLNEDFNHENADTANLRPLAT